MKLSVFLIFYLFHTTTSVSLSVQTNMVEFCDSDVLVASKQLDLASVGINASKTVTLSPQTFAAVCKLTVVAPRNHVVNMHFLDFHPNFHRALLFNNSDPRPPCTMSIYLPDDQTTPFWEGDPCSHEPLPSVDLLTPEFEVVWAPPPNPNYTRGRKIILTSVGKGIVCKQPGQHICMRTGRIPMFCVADALLCDGIENCPKGATSSDENELVCNGDHLLHQASWEQLAQEFAVKILKKFKPTQEDMVANKANNWLNDDREKELLNKKGHWHDWEHIQRKDHYVESSTEKPTISNKKPKSDSFSAILSKYGPWGYLMLGLLICGSVLIVCGIWECCFKKPKDLGSASNQAPPTTVLIINGNDEHHQIAPPTYDDLDEPPSYTTLFPNYKVVPSRSGAIRHIASTPGSFGAHLALEPDMSRTQNVSDFSENNTFYSARSNFIENNSLNSVNNSNTANVENHVAQVIRENDPDSTNSTLDTTNSSLDTSNSSLDTTINSINTTNNSPNPQDYSVNTTLVGYSANNDVIVPNFENMRTNSTFYALGSSLVENSALNIVNSLVNAENHIVPIIRENDPHSINDSINTTNNSINTRDNSTSTTNNSINMTNNSINTISNSINTTNNSTNNTNSSINTTNSSVDMNNSIQSGGL